MIKTSFSKARKNRNATINMLSKQHVFRNRKFFIRALKICPVNSSLSSKRHIYKYTQKHSKREAKKSYNLDHLIIF